MKKTKPDILGGTFSNLHIVNKKMNINSIIEEMGIEEKHSIKLITSSPRNEFLRMRILRKKMKNNNQTITHTNNILHKKMSFPLIQKKPKLKKNVKNLLLDDKNIINDKDSSLNRITYSINKDNIKTNENEQFLEKVSDYNLTIKNGNDEIKKQSLFKNKKNNEKLIFNHKNEKINISSLTKKPQMKTINNININNSKFENRNSNFQIESMNKEKRDKYYQTAKFFSEQKLFSQRKTHTKKKTLLSKTNSVSEVKKIPRLKISDAHLTDIENKLNTVYETNKNEFLEKDKTINEFKKKYQNLFDYNEKLYSYDIARITKEINDQLLSLKFKDFYSYLLTILKNYDKHIVDWKFEIEKDKNECPPELRLKNVKLKHKKFMGKLNRQYDSGLRANKFMDDLLLNSKKKSMLYKNIKNKNNFQELANKKLSHDDFVNRIFESNQLYQNNEINDEKQ